MKLRSVRFGLARTRGERADSASVPVPEQLFASVAVRPPATSCSCCDGPLADRLPWLVDAIRRCAYCDPCALDAGHGDLVARAAAAREQLGAGAITQANAERICRALLNGE